SGNGIRRPSRSRSPREPLGAARTASSAGGPTAAAARAKSPGGRRPGARRSARRSTRCATSWRPSTRCARATSCATRGAPAAATPARVAATAAMLALHGEAAEVPGYTLHFSAGPADGRLVADAEVREEATGATARVHVAAERAPGAPARCRAAEQDFTLADAFGAQRERLLAALVRGVERSLHEELRRPGVVLPAAWLASALERVLDDRLRDLPRGAADALALLDLAEAAGVQLDLGPAQVRALGGWQASPPPVRAGETVAALCPRLAPAPEDAGASGP